MKELCCKIIFIVCMEISQVIILDLIIILNIELYFCVVFLKVCYYLLVFHTAHKCSLLQEL